MRWLAFGIGITTFAAAFALGLWLGRGQDERGKRVAAGVIGACLLVVLARLLLRPHVEFALFSFDGYALVRPWWPVPFALILLGAGARQMETQNARRGLVVFASLLFVAASYPMLRTALFDPGTLTGRVGPDGVCRQTTDYTCGAAAAASLLAHYGIEATEREMAERCWTNALTGTDAFCVARGLRQKLAGTGRTLRLRKANWQTLRERREPALATIRWSLMVDHWVVVQEAASDHVVVGDPLQGVRRIPKPEFLRIWRHNLLTAEPP